MKFWSAAFLAKKGERIYQTSNPKKRYRKPLDGSFSHVVPMYRQAMNDWQIVQP